ncbi:MAG: hypothetical protein ACK4K7_11150 [Allosphingosinicella sp.]|uniref:hypothetical protein n=1 Tax=Allosphingosinicella sp. TaxID=2823234 RepID=UPI003943EF60
MKSLKFGIKAAAIALASSAALADPGPAGAQLFLEDPGFERGPIEPSDPLVGLPIPGATPAEYRAHLLWNLRSGLNVAALQCQFSPFLRAVPNYNALLAHHSGELATAYNTMIAYFRRVHGQREGLRMFDDYTTTTYNNFSTLYAQQGFCQTASAITKEALTKPKGDLHQVAVSRMRELRSSLVPAHPRLGVYNPYLVTQTIPRVIPLPDCSGLRGRQRRQCEAQA